MAPAAADDERVEFRGLPVRDEFRGLSRGRPFRGAVPNHSTQPKGSQQAAPSCLSPAITGPWANSPGGLGEGGRRREGGNTRRGLGGVEGTHDQP